MKRASKIEITIEEGIPVDEPVMVEMKTRTGEVISARFVTPDKAIGLVGGEICVVANGNEQHQRLPIYRTWHSVVFKANRRGMSAAERCLEDDFDAAFLELEREKNK